MKKTSEHTSKLKESSAEKEKLSEEKAKPPSGLVNRSNIGERIQSLSLQVSESENSEERTFRGIFVSVLSCLSNKERLKLVRKLVNALLDLFKEDKVNKEIKDCLEFLKEWLCQLAYDTRHNFEIDRATVINCQKYLSIIKEALESSTPGGDIDTALETLLADENYKRLLTNNPSVPQGECKKIREYVSQLKNIIQSRVSAIKNNQVVYKAVPKLGLFAGAGMTASASAAIIDSLALGGTGSIIMFGVAFPPLGIVILSSAIAGFCISAMILILTKLWQRRQMTGLKDLDNRENDAKSLAQYNNSFRNIIDKRDEIKNKLAVNIDFLKKNDANKSERFHKIKLQACNESIKAIDDLLETSDEMANLKRSLSSSSAITQEQLLKKSQINKNAMKEEPTNTIQTEDEPVNSLYFINETYSLEMESMDSQGKANILLKSNSTGNNTLETKLKKSSPSERSVIIHEGLVFDVDKDGNIYM